MEKAAFLQAGLMLAPSPRPVAASLQAPCQSPQPPLPAALSLGGTGQQRGCPHSGMGIAGDAGASLSTSQAWSSPSPHPPRAGARWHLALSAPSPPRASTGCCPVPAGPRLTVLSRWTSAPQPSPLQGRGRSGCWGPAAASRPPEQAVRGQRAGERKGSGWCYLPGTKLRHRLLK